MKYARNLLDLAFPVLGFLHLIVFTYSCDNSSASAINYQQTKLSLEDQEKNNPVNFLTTTGMYRPTLFGDKMVITGTITNNATIATFKDAVIEVHFYSKTKTEIGVENHIVYDYFPPKQTQNFRSKIKVPDGTTSLGWNVVSAGVQ